jgi:hypothetical protein
MRQRRRLIEFGGRYIIGLGLRCRRIEQLARPRNVVGAGSTGEQAVVADAVEAVGQDVDEEAADELVGGERPALVPRAAVGAIVLTTSISCPQHLTNQNCSVLLKRFRIVPILLQKSAQGAERATIESGR